jgi:CheY-like chemotaxis protein
MRVLIAEDDKISARVLSAAVTGLGYEVVLAKDGREALDFLLRKQVQTFDVLITDWVMPRMDGIDLIREATQAGVRPALVIMSTGERIQSAAQRLALDVGVDDFITKPLQIAQIRRCLTKGLEALGLSHPPPRPAPGPAPKPAPRPAPKPAPMVPPHIPRLLPMRGPTLVRSAHQATKTSARPRKLCVIAASTGGPPVVHALFSEKRLPPRCQLPCAHSRTRMGTAADGFPAWQSIRA